MIRLLIILILTVSILNCKYRKLSDFQLFIENKEAYNHKQVKLQGFIYIQDLYSITFHGRKAGKHYFDVVFQHGTTINKKLDLHKYYCVDIEGIYNDYNERVIAISGVVKSKLGLIEVNKIKECAEKK